MTTLGERLREEKHVMLKKEFDFDTFARFIEDKLSSGNSVTIGICPDWMFEESLRNYRQTEGYLPSKWLTFVGGYECGYWRTSCQIPLRFYREISSWLSLQGLKSTLKGLAGFDNYDVIIVTL